MLGVETFLLRRQTETIDANGFGVRSYVETSIKGVLQALTGNDIRRMPEGDQGRADRKFYTKQDLRSTSKANGTPPDLLVVDGEEFEISNVKRYRKGLSHYKAILLSTAGAI